MAIDVVRKSLFVSKGTSVNQANCDSRHWFSFVFAVRTLFMIHDVTSFIAAVAHFERVVWELLLLAFNKNEFVDLVRISRTCV